MSRTNHERPKNERDDFSRVTNAARDVADTFRRFERDFARLQRASKDALEAGMTEAEVTRAVNFAGVGRSDRAEALRTIVARLEATR